MIRCSTLDEYELLIERLSKALTCSVIGCRTPLGGEANAGVCVSQVSAWGEGLKLIQNMIGRFTDKMVCFLFMIYRNLYSFSLSILRDS